MDGRAYLDRYIADRLPAGRRRSQAGRPSVDRSEIRGVAIGLVAAGALAQEQMERVLADLDQELERLGWLNRTEARVSGHGHLAPEHWAPLSAEARQQLVLQHGLDRLQERPAPVDAARLLEVIPLAGRHLVLDAATAALISLERWSTMLVLRLALPDTGAGDLRSLDRMSTRLRRWRGWDDAGTQYRCHTASAETRDGASIQTLVFHPGAPDQARTMTLVFEHDHASEPLVVALGATPTST